MRWRVFWTVAASAALLTVGENLVQACGPDADPYDYYPSFFDNRLPERNAFGDFRYSAFTGLLYEDGWYGTRDSLADTADANRAEWAAYTGGVPLADIDSFVYRFSREDLNGLYGTIEKGTPAALPAAVAANAMSAWFRRSADLEALGYLMYAKQCEPFVGGSDDPWNLPARDTVRMAKLLKNGLQLHAAAKKDFIRDRYTFQVLRLALYGGQPARTLHLYDSLGAANTSGNMQDRCLGLQAGALYKLKKYDEAAYRYSLLFDRSDEEKRSAYISYDWSRGYTAADRVLKHCKTPHERAVVHLLTALHEYEEALPALERAYAEDPGVNGLDAVFTREINKVEDRWLQEELMSQRRIRSAYYWTPYWEGTYAPDFGPEKREATRAHYRDYLQQLAAFGKKVAGSGKAGHLAYWHLALAYVASLRQDYTGSEAQLAAAKAAGLSPLERDQHDVIRLLNIAKSEPTITAGTEAKMLASLRWLDERRKTSDRLDKTYRDFCSTFLTGAYLTQRDTVKAIFALARAERGWTDGNRSYTVDPDFGDDPGSLLQTASPAQFEAVKTFVGRNGTSEYDRWLIGGNSYPLPLLYELEGTRHLREHDFEAAVAALRKSDAKTLRRVLLPDPFVLHVQEDLELSAEDTTRWFTKLAFAERMAALKGKDDAASLFAYGQGLYAMTYYGKAHHAFDYYRSSVDDAGYYADTSRLRMKPAERDYYEATSAEAAFVKAAAATTDGELKAKALFLAARCWQKRAPMPAVKYSFERNETKDYYRYSLRNPYFKRLKTEVPNTRWYAEAEKVCEYLSDYAKKK